jgi:hypothetical protein
MTSGKRTTNETAQVGERGDGENAGSVQMFESNH